MENPRISALVAPLLALAVAGDGGGYRASARLAVPAPSLAGDPLVYAANFRALLETDQVVDAVSSALRLSRRDVRRRVRSRQVGRGSVVEVTYEGNGTRSTAERAAQAAVVEGLRAAFSVELADAEPSVSARARSRLEVVAGEAREATASRRSGQRTTAVGVSAAIGIVLAVAGLLLAERLGAGEE